MNVNDTITKKVDKLIYLGSEINSEGKVEGGMNRGIQNISKF
jgi:hypothetical protein